MKWMLCPDSFKGSLSAEQAAQAMAEGILAVEPEAEIVRFPIADGGEGVGGLARLGHRHDQRRRRDDGIAVAELAGDLHLAGDARPALDEVLGDKARMVGGAARNNVDAIDQVELGRRHRSTRRRRA